MITTAVSHVISSIFCNQFLVPITTLPNGQYFCDGVLPLPLPFVDMAMYESGPPPTLACPGPLPSAATALLTIFNLITIHV
jgi:hypothetical protein